MELTACLHLLFRLATDSVSTRLAWACRAYFLVLDFSFEESSIRRSTESPQHLNIVFNLPQLGFVSKLVDFCVKGGQLTVLNATGLAKSGPFFVLQRQDLAEVRDAD